MQEVQPPDWTSIQYTRKYVSDPMYSNVMHMHVRNWLRDNVFERMHDPTLVSLLRKTSNMRVSKIVSRQAVRKSVCPVIGYTRVLEYDIYVRDKRYKYRCSAAGARLIGQIIELKRMLQSVRESGSTDAKTYSDHLTDIAQRIQHSVDGVRKKV